MDFLANLATGAASGGLFGLLGSVVSVGAKWLQERQRQKWEREKHVMEMDTLKLQMEARAEETEQEIALAGERGSWAGLEASHKAAARLTDKVHRWVNDVRALFRPILTLTLVGSALYIFVALLAGLRGQDTMLAQILTNGQAVDLLRYTVESMVFAANTAVVWWFGDRAMSPPSAKDR